MKKQTTIQETYFDALYFASSTQNEHKPFAISPAQFRLIIKLIHYGNADKYITWSSENISKHICTPISSIDKSIQRLKQKSYITVWNTQKGETVKTRTIQINWDFITTINEMYLEWLNKDETPTIEESIQPETKSNRIEQLLEYLDENPGNIRATKKLDIQGMIKSKSITTEEEIDEIVIKNDINRFKQKAI